MLVYMNNYIINGLFNCTVPDPVNHKKTDMINSYLFRLDLNVFRYFIVSA